MKALTLINLCAREFQDTAFARIAKSGATGANWLDWLNDAQRAVVLVRPDASAVTENIILVAGTKQTLPAARERLLDVTRNMGAGSTPGKVLKFIDRPALDDVNPDWMTAASASPVREVIYNDKKDPLTFWVNPPAVANWRIEAVMSASPTDVTDPDNGDIDLGDLYAPPMQEWMLYRGYSMNVQAPGYLQRAGGHFGAFFNLLGVKIRSEMFTAANAPGALVTTDARR